MARKSARRIAAGISKTVSHSQDNVHELVARQAMEIEGLKLMIEETDKVLQANRRDRVLEETKRNEWHQKHLEDLPEIAGIRVSKKIWEKEKEVIELIKQKTEAFMQKQQQEEVGKDGEPFGWQLCGICYVKFSEAQEHTPRILSCRHTYCLGCIEELAKIFMNNTVRCPSCLKVTKFTKETDIQKNFAVLEMCK
ncbi:hypothetical protein CAEBREN_01713 [Caenorhabditis brenneri]|uniref:RING-type domain-containing protein n=1 Tax=Caenorhabditis brenneri TaxID=135651 RepID=G0M7D2_CAEBE|nr:hypothetical protein CAEBREN_01713 [Caenorhabditis brenneri]